MKRIFAILLFVVTMGSDQGAIAQPQYSLVSVQRAFVLSGDARFDPMVQRLLAQNALRSLPIGNHSMLIVIPDDADAVLQEAQIRYLNELMQRHIERDRPNP
jgi:hypothetical protein